MRGVAIFLVVLSHVLGSEQAGVLQMYPPTLPSIVDLDWLNHFLYSVHVPLFLIVSGFASVLLSSSAQATVRQFLLSRWWRLVVPLLCWAPLGYVFRCSLRGLHYSWSDVIERSIFEPFFIFWFFHALLFASVAAFFYLRCGGSAGTYLLLSLTGALLAVGLNNLYGGGWESCQFYLYWNVFYALGIFGAARLEWLHGHIRRLPRRRTLIGCALGSLGLIAAQSLIPAQYFMVTRLVNGTLAFGCLYLLLGTLRNLKTGRLLALVQYLGQLSMVIYLFHVYFGVAIRQLLGAIFGFSQLVLPLHVILGCAVSLWGPVVLYLLLKPSKAFAFATGAGR